MTRRASLVRFIRMWFRPIPGRYSLDGIRDEWLTDDALEEIRADIVQRNRWERDFNRRNCAPAARMAVAEHQGRV